MALLERFWFGCGHCHGASGCPYVDGDGPEAAAATLRGPMLVLTVLLVFVVPLLTALIGARVVERWVSAWPDSLAIWCQAGGLVAGLAVGVVLARTILARMHRDRCSEAGGAGNDCSDS